MGGSGPGACVLLGFKSEGLNPKPKRINAKVKNMKVQKSESMTGESSNKFFHHVPWGIPMGLFIGPLGGWFIMSKQPLTAPQIALSIRSQGHHSLSQFTCTSMPSQSKIDMCPLPQRLPLGCFNNLAPLKMLWRCSLWLS
jgi:hypothetical protein